MARASIAAALMSLLVTAGAAGPALAQFPFGDIPRPPSDVPRPPSDTSLRPSRPPGPPPSFPNEPPPGAVQDPSAGLQPRPPRGGVQTQPLPPPPGASELRPQVPGDDPRSPTAALPGPNQGQDNVPAGGAPPGQTARPQQPAAPPPADEVVVEMPSQKIANPTAVFAGLDKITGRTISFDVAINETVQFGALQVTPRVCYTRPPTETPNTDAFAEVEEVTLQGEIRRIFAGWMFAASPGLHGVEHPIYDVWLTDCKGGTPPQTAAVEPPPPAPTPPPPRAGGSQARPAGQAPRGTSGGTAGRPPSQAPQAQQQQQQPGVQSPPGAQLQPPPGALPPPPLRR